MLPEKCIRGSWKITVLRRCVSTLSLFSILWKNTVIPAEAGIQVCEFDTNIVSRSRLDSCLRRNDRLQSLRQYILGNTSKVARNIEFEDIRWFLVVVCHLSHELFDFSNAKKRASSLSSCVVIVDEESFKFWMKPVGKEVMNDSITKSRYKYLSLHRIGEIDQLIGLWLICSIHDFPVELDTVRFIVLFKFHCLRSSPFTTATIKVCLKYIGEHRVPARKQRRALEASLKLTSESPWLSHILRTLWPSRVPDA